MNAGRSWNAVVTGAGSGLGRALTVELAARGGRIIVSDIDQGGAEETARLAQANGGEVHIMPCDVSDRDSVFAVVDACVERFGSIDFIANNAGVAVAGEFGEVSMDDWRWIVDINLWGVIYGCQAALPHMKKQRRGYIVNVASAAGLLSPPNMAPYNITKAGVVSLSETLYAEAKPDGVNVAVLCPTFFKTAIMDAGRGVRDPKMESFVDKAMRRSRVQAPDVAKAALNAVRDGKLYIQPMRDGRAMWRVKRLAPQRFYDSMIKVQERLAR